MADLVVEPYGTRAGKLVVPMSLAPAYEVVPQAHQPNDGERALAVEGEYRNAAVTLATVLDTVRSDQPHERAHPGLAAQLEAFTTNLLTGREAGLPSRGL